MLRIYSVALDICRDASRIAELIEKHDTSLAKGAAASAVLASSAITRRLGARAKCSRVTTPPKRWATSTRSEAKRDAASITSSGRS